MIQEWNIFNLSKGKVLNLEYEANILEKDISIDALLLLLENEWCGDRILLSGDRDDHYESSDVMKEWIDQFLSKHSLTYAQIQMRSERTYTLATLPIMQTHLVKQRDIEFVDEECDLIFPFELDEDQEEEEKSQSYFLLSNGYKRVDYESVQKRSHYTLVNHTKKVYVHFDAQLYKQRSYIVAGLLASHSANGRGIYDLPEAKWIGMFCGDSISFERNIEYKDYRNISHIFLGRVRSGSGSGNKSKQIESTSYSSSLSSSIIASY